jgi:hypothetical protein
VSKSDATDWEKRPCEYAEVIVSSSCFALLSLELEVLSDRRRLVKSLPQE